MRTGLDIGGVRPPQPNYSEVRSPLPGGLLDTPSWSERDTLLCLVVSYLPHRATARCSVANDPLRRHPASMTAEGLQEAVDSYAQAQDELVEARNGLARAIAGAAMAGLSQDEIVELRRYPAELVLRICTEARVIGTDAEHGLVCLRRFAVDGMLSRPARKTKVTYLCGPRPAARVSPSPPQG
jgi:hypothetical protein